MLVQAAQVSTACSSMGHLRAVCYSDTIGKARHPRVSLGSQFSTMLALSVPCKARSPPWHPWCEELTRDESNLRPNRCSIYKHLFNHTSSPGTIPSSQYSWNGNHILVINAVTPPARSIFRHTLLLESRRELVLRFRLASAELIVRIPFLWRSTFAMQQVALICCAAVTTSSPRSRRVPRRTFRCHGHHQGDLAGENAGAGYSCNGRACRRRCWMLYLSLVLLLSPVLSAPE
ncbi:hypothetical protein CONLIGDRAFT_142813 [Coniochaeta ligniaria NRRL 30616]|uniref:Uncharacterized protein n=1 Tax=Coniochaeta ligniaria NRRL 30616 TaxID=1408157 RepID=A0A1J7IZR1_9PEZI|nr:hypothetical protein CONLIGDRAFT_142813 [Coniochaeta ligniaria NRRL 30616]